MQLLIFLMLAIASLLFVSLLAILVSFFIWGSDFIFNSALTADMNDPAQIAFLKLFQFANQLGMLVIPAFAFALIAQKKAYLNYLGLKTNPKIIPSALTIVLIFSMLPFIVRLAEWNEALELPAALSGLETWMMEQEAKAAQIVEIFLNVRGIPALLANVLIIAVMPALGEELVFRGVLQNIFSRWTKNAHMGIIITAVIFSAIHMQFYGFLPRFLLGMIFGYLYLWSGSLWLPILAHFINNFGATIAGYLAFNSVTETSAEDFGHTESYALITASFFISIAIISLIYKYYRDGKTKAE